MNEQEKILQVDGLSIAVEQQNRRFELVKNVQFFLKPQETVALVGESGSGKTTTANALLRLLPEKRGFSTSGRILFDNEDILQLDDRALRQIRGAKISMIFQDPTSALNPVLSIGNQIAEVFTIHTNAENDEAELRTIQALEEVGLHTIKHPFDTYPHQLSGGMKQRVMIAMAIALGPKVLIADEPTSALDLTVQKEILELLKTCQEMHQMAELLITHDFSVVEQVADRVLVMYLGEIVESASCTELFTSPSHPYTKSLMLARPTKENRKKPLATVAGTIPKSNSRPAGCPFHTRCPFVMERCKTEEPTSYSLTPTHSVRCFLYEDKK